MNGTLDDIVSCQRSSTAESVLTSRGFVICRTTVATNGTAFYLTEFNATMASLLSKADPKHAPGAMTGAHGSKLEKKATI